MDSQTEARIHEIADNMVRERLRRMVEKIHASSIGGNALRDQTSVTRAELVQLVEEAML